MTKVFVPSAYSSFRFPILLKPVQSKDAQKDTLQGKIDTSSQPDANQPAGQDTENPQPKPEEKNEGGGGGGCNCAIENPNDPSTLNALLALGTSAAAWALRRRQQVAEVLKRK